MRKRGYTRLPVEERRQRLLEIGAEMFARHSYDELSMGRIAKEAGISKPLLYHYFPGKRAFFAATLQQAADEGAARAACRRCANWSTECATPRPRGSRSRSGWIKFQRGAPPSWAGCGSSTA